jgi:hypothetical protein
MLILTPSNSTGANSIEPNSISGSTVAPNISAHHWALARGFRDLMWAW